MNPHQTLGLPAEANLSDARAAYKRLAMKYHPDRPDGSPEKFDALRKALAYFEQQDAADLFEDIFKDIARRAKQ